MQPLGKIFTGMLAGLAGLARLQADDVAATNSPYAPIPDRNAFSLSAPATPTVPAVATPAGPTARITANGLISLFGQMQVLFKVEEPGGPGQPPVEASYILGEHQGKGGIEVLAIDATTRVITFNNHGTVQNISLTGTPPIVAPILAMNEPAANVPKSYPKDFIRARTPDYLGGGPEAVADTNSVMLTNLEQRVIMIEAQRAYLKSQHDPAADLLPPTAMTPEQ